MSREQGEQIMLMMGIGGAMASVIRSLVTERKYEVSPAEVAYATKIEKQWLTHWPKALLLMDELSKLPADFDPITMGA